MAYIDASLGEPLTVPVLAGVAGMSPSHFTALFKHSTGVPPHEAVLRRRIARAKELLEDDARTIAAIGCQLGFSSQAHFTTVFRRRVGMAPSTFRRGRAGAGHRPYGQNFGESCNPAGGM
jgi:AraC family transcriptional regulator